MTPEQIALVQTTWAQVAPNSKEVANIFYRRLFEIAPEVIPLFPDDMEEQGRKLMQTLALAVASLTRLEDILPAVQEMGRRHIEYDVKEEQYDTVGVALLWTLEQGLGDQFTPEVAEAWAQTYTTLANAMKDAAATVP